MSHFSGFPEYPTDVLHRMASADAFKSFLVHSLRIDRNTVDTINFHEPQFFLRDSIRTTRFHSIFHIFCGREQFLHFLQQTFQLFLCQRGRCAAADVDIFQTEVLGVFCQIFHFFEHGIQILVHSFFILLQGISRKGTV